MKKLIIKFIFFLFLKEKKMKIETFGSKYGGWSIHPFKTKKNIIISAGLGEDASFDIEMINFFESIVHILDPTPKAVQHISDINKDMGNYKSLNYSDDGKQNTKAYDLSNSKFKKNLIFHKLALSGIDTNDFKMYLPLKVDYSSYSHYKNITRNSNFIKVRSVSLKKFIELNKLNYINLLKLDIEGEELSVLIHVLSNNIKVNQICVEFDSLKYFHITNFIKFIYLVFLLRSANYKVIFKNFESLTFTFINDYD